MRLLADTHILLWWLADDPALSATHRGVLADMHNQVSSSAVSIAEIAINASLGKLEIPEDVAGTLVAGGFSSLDFRREHAELLRHLPWHHRDPFDRMLVAQALHEGLVLLTDDARLAEYGVRVI